MFLPLAPGSRQEIATYYALLFTALAVGTLTNSATIFHRVSNYCIVAPTCDRGSKTCDKPKTWSMD